MATVNVGNKGNSDLEFEKNRQEILRMTQKTNYKKNYLNEETFFSTDPNSKALWEYEIIEHRKRKKRENFILFGGMCGFISLIISFGLVLNLFFNFF